MPGPTGLALQEALASQSEQLPIIFLSGHADISAGVRAMKAGAVDFLTKPVERPVLLAAISTALARDVENRSAAPLARWRNGHDTLTARELRFSSAWSPGR
jgi:FixJ family two-component response regulator